MSRFIQPKTKVRFPLPRDHDGPESEVLWAQEVGRNRYRIENCPFFVYGVSLHDVVSAVPDRDRIPTFRRVLQKSGNRTLRVAFGQPSVPGNRTDETLRGLLSLGCGYEGADAMCFAVNVPSIVSFDAVRNYLNERAMTWEHADPPDEDDPR